MHRFVTSTIFLVASSLIACSSGESTPPGSSQGALAGENGDPVDKDGGTGGGDGSCGDPGKGDGCFTQAIEGCQSYDDLKQLVAEKCGVPGLTIVSIDFGPACCDGKADGVKYTCCAAPPPPLICKDFPIPPELCKDPAALKEYAAKTCEGASPGLSLPDGDPCSPKATVECCEVTPPPPPPPVCKDFPIPPELCKDSVALKDYAVKTCASPYISFPDGDPCSPKSAIECCEDASPPPTPPKK